MADTSPQPAPYFRYGNPHVRFNAGVRATLSSAEDAVDECIRAIPPGTTRLWLDVDEIKGHLPDRLWVHICSLEGLEALGVSMYSGTEIQLHKDLGKIQGLKELSLFRGICTKDLYIIIQLKSLEVLRLCFDREIPEVMQRLHEALVQLGQLKALALEVQFLRVPYYLPADIGKLATLEALRLAGFLGVRELPEGYGQLQGLVQLEMDNMFLTELPDWVTGLGNLKYLRVHGCTRLQQLPKQLGNLTKLHCLDVSYCSMLTTLPESVGKLRMLEELDLSHCHSLLTLPASLVDLSSLGQLHVERCDSLPRLPSHDMEISQKLRYLMARCLRQLAVTKLATQQPTMLTTLERMSWVMVLLATVTFMAFIQPPGGYSGDDHQVLVGNFTHCLSSSPQPGYDEATAAALSSLGSRHCALLAFFVMDSLSFSLSLGCVLVIIGLSMPRLQHRDPLFEAGRFWLVLVFTWVLLFLAVFAGFGAFVASAFAMYSQSLQVLVVPVVVGVILCLIGLCIMINRFAAIFPGWYALQIAVEYWSCCCWSWECKLSRSVWCLHPWLCLLPPAQLVVGCVFLLIRRLHYKYRWRSWTDFCGCYPYEPDLAAPEEDVGQLLMGDRFWDRAREVLGPKKDIEAGLMDVPVQVIAEVPESQAGTPGHAATAAAAAVVPDNDEQPVDGPASGRAAGGAATAGVPSAAASTTPATEGIGGGVPSSPSLPSFPAAAASTTEIRPCDIELGHPPTGANRSVPAGGPIQKAGPPAGARCGAFGRLFGVAPWDGGKEKDT